jgi:stage V sporulation protein B
MAMRFANLITIPSFVGMCLLATPISQMLYGTPNAGVPIAILSGGVIMLGMHQITTGVLQGLGYTAIPLINMTISAAVKIVMSWTLTAIPSFGIKGAAWATNVDFALAALLNMYFVYRYVGFSINIKDTLKTVAAAIIMGAVVLLTYDAVMAKTLHNTMATLASVCIGAIVYSIILLLLGGIEQEDIEKLPKIGSKLARLLTKIGILRK